MYFVTIFCIFWCVQSSYTLTGDTTAVTNYLQEYGNNVAEFCTTRPYGVIRPLMCRLIRKKFPATSTTTTSTATATTTTPTPTPKSCNPEGGLFWYCQQGTARYAKNCKIDGTQPDFQKLNLSNADQCADFCKSFSCKQYNWNESTAICSGYININPANTAKPVNFNGICGYT